MFMGSLRSVVDCQMVLDCYMELNSWLVVWLIVFNSKVDCECCCLSFVQLPYFGC